MCRISISLLLFVSMAMIGCSAKIKNNEQNAYSNNMPNIEKQPNTVDISVMVVKQNIRSCGDGDLAVGGQNYRSILSH